MSNFPDLLTSFDDAVEALKVKLSQDPNARITYNGEEIQSIAADVVDQYAEIKSELNALTENQQSGVIVFQTYAALTAYAPANTTEEKGSFKVANDPDSSLNGYYSWVSGTTYTKDADDVANQVKKEVNASRVTYIVANGGGSAIDFRFSENKVVIKTGNQLFSYGDDAYQAIADVGDVVLPIPANARWLVYNSVTSTFRLHANDQLPLREYMTDTDYLVAVLGLGGTSLVYAYLSAYSIDGKAEPYPFLPRASVGGFNVTQTTVTMKYSKVAGTVSFPSEVFLFCENAGIYSITETNMDLVNGEYQVPYAQTDRYLLFNTETKLMRGVPGISNIEPRDVLVAVLHGVTGDAYEYNSTGYSYEGNTRLCFWDGYVPSRYQASIGSVSSDQSKITMFYNSTEGTVKFPVGLFIFSQLMGQVSFADTNIPIVEGYHGVSYASSDRHLIYNHDTKLMRGVPIGGLANLGASDVLVADIHGGSGAVMNYHSSGYNFNGKSYVNWSEPELTFKEVVWGSASLPASVPPIDFAFDEGKIKISAHNSNGMYTPDGFVFLNTTNHPVTNGVYEVAIGGSHRTLVYDTETKLFSATAGTMDSLSRTQFACAYFAGNAVLHVRASNYAVNGAPQLTAMPKTALSSTVLDDNRILYNYVRGQEKAADRFNVPFLNIWQKGGINQFNYTPYFNAPEDLLHMNASGYTKWIVPTTNFIKVSCDDLDLTGKTMGVFGGSWAEGGASLTSAWENELGLVVTNYAIGGYGFTTNAAGQVDSQIADAAVHDIYLLWCSTNDCGGNAPIGDDNSPIDLTTQMGGIGKAVQDLITKNPSCRILLLSSGPAFNNQINWDTGAIR